MKFLMTLFQIQDYGGIINHAEYLAKGLKELGHEVDFCVLVPRHKVVERKVLPKDKHQYRKVGTGYPFHQGRGWFGVPKKPYLNDLERFFFRKQCSNYDAVLWHIPVPTLAKDNKGIQQWRELYDNGTKNIAIIHDGNLPELYPHLISVADHFHAAVCVHESAMRSGKMLNIPRKLIVNPFDLSDRDSGGDFETRSGLAAFQVFKAWKRVDTLIRSIPYMDNEEAKVIGGEGIEYRYMTSKEKCKPKYYNDAGERIWDEATRIGMRYLGTVPNDKVFSWLRKAKVQIDPSYSNKYSSYGAHFNRTTVEAIICGAVPMATDLGMKDSQLFKSGENYGLIPAGCDPMDFAGRVDELIFNKNKWLRIRENNEALLTRFDMLNVAQEYVDLAKSADGLEVGEPQEIDLKRCTSNLEFFGIKDGA